MNVAKKSGELQAFLSEAQICVLGALLNTVGSGIFYVMPIYSDAVAARLHSSGSAIGLIDSLETVSLALAAIALSMAGGRFGPRAMIGCSLVACAGNLMVGLMPDITSLALLRVVTGLFGEGPLCAYSYVVLGKMSRPERGLGVSLTSVALFSAIAMRFPIRAPWSGGGDSLLLLAFLCIPTALLLLCAPDTLRTVRNARSPLAHAASGMPAPAARSGWPIAATLVAQALWAAAPGVLWPFAAQIAQRGGALPRNVNDGIALSPLIGLLGSALPVLAGKFVSYRLGALLATGGLSAAALLLPFAGTAASLAICLGGFVISWNLAQVYQPAIIASIDPTGRGMAMVPAMQLIGMAGGTAAAGLAIDRWGTATIPWICAALALLATPAFLLWVKPEKSLAKMETYKAITVSPMETDTA